MTSDKIRNDTTNSHRIFIAMCQISRHVIYVYTYTFPSKQKSRLLLNNFTDAEIFIPVTKSEECRTVDRPIYLLYHIFLQFCTSTIYIHYCVHGRLRINRIGVKCTRLISLVYRLSKSNDKILFYAKSFNDTLSLWCLLLNVLVNCIVTK